MYLSFTRLLTAVLLAASCQLATAATYYVSPGGDDGASGTQTNRAWRTLDRVNAADLAPGDRVLFARGGTWRGQLRPSSQGAPGSPITFSAYGQGARPLLLGSVAIGSGGGNWEDLGGGVYRSRTSFEYDVGSLSFGGDDARLGIKRGSRDGLRANGDFYFDPGTRRLYLRSGGNPNVTYGAIEAALTRDIVNLDGRNHITISNLHLRRGAAHGVRGAWTTGTTVADCEIAWIGGGYLDNGSVVERYGNGVEFWAGTWNARVERNFIHDIFDTGVTNQYFSSPTADQIDVAYTANVIVRCGLASFEMANSSGGVSQFIRFTNNTSVAAGEGWGRYDGPQREGPFAGAKIGAHLAFTNQQVASPNNGLEVVNNVFYGSIRMFTFRNEAFDMWGQTTFRNNVYYVADPAGIQLYATWDNDTQTGRAFLYDEFDAYRAAEGKDQGSLQAEPQFVNLAGGDYRPRAGSPLVGAGAPVPNDALDFEGDPRPDDAPVTIGAFEVAGGSNGGGGGGGGETSGDVTSGTTYQLVRKGSSKALDVVWNLPVPINVQLWEANPTTGQQWTATRRGDGAFELRHLNTDQCLAVDGDNVRQSYCNGASEQAWAVVVRADGFYTVRRAGTDRVLTAYATDDGANVEQATDTGGDAQRWAFRPVGANTARATASGTTASGTTATAGFAAWPNPTSGELVLGLDAPSDTDAAYEVFDVSGARHTTLSAGVVPAGETRVRLDLSGLPNGTYVLRVERAGAFQSERITVQR